MTEISPIKSSSRAGRFKKKLVSLEDLVTEAPLIQAKLTPFQELFTSSQLSQADFTACYLLVYLSHRFPGTWPGAKKVHTPVAGVPWRELPFAFEPNVMKRLEGINSVYEIFSSFGLKSTPITVNRAILEWHKGNYGLELMFRIPSSEEVLKQQIHGRRCVTALVDKRISSYILGERDALSFTMHDLIHADHFYFHNECYRGQLGFYGLLSKTLPYFDLGHEKFAVEFEYLISDMNAYAIHLMKCLKSAMTFYFDQGYYETWLAPLNAPEAAFKLNTQSYLPETMDSEILAWLDRFRES